MGVNGGAYRCPKCKAPSKVIDTRPTGREGVHRRRRECVSRDCTVRFTTYEVPESLFMEFANSIRVLDSFKQALADINRITNQKG